MKKSTQKLGREARKSFDAERRRTSASEREAARAIISRTLHALRRRAGLTQQELARKSGLTQPEVSRFERTKGHRLPELVTVIRLVDACGFKLTFEPKFQQDPQGGVSGE